MVLACLASKRTRALCGVFCMPCGEAVSVDFVACYVGICLRRIVPCMGLEFPLIDFLVYVNKKTDVGEDGGGAWLASPHVALS